MKTNKIAVKDDLVGNIEEKYSCWLKMKRIIALMLKWKINTEQKKKMMPRRSERVARSREIYCEDGGIKVL